MRALWKDIFRTIRRTWTRFLAIFAIVALGVGFLAGLAASAPDMKLTADEYYDRTNLMNVRVVSTLGLTDEDVEVLAAQEGVTLAYPYWALDALVHGPTGEQVVHLMTVPQEEINLPELTEGRWPQSASEIVLDASKKEEKPAIGEKVILSDANSDEILDGLALREFTVVGYASSSQYVNFQRGSSSIGDGNIRYYGYLLPEAFTLEAYTCIDLLIDGAKELNCYTDEYETLIDGVVDRLEELAPEREQARYDGILADANEELADARAELEEKTAEADEKLAEAAQKIEDAKAEIADGEQQLLDGREELEKGEKEYSRQKKKFEQGIADAQEQLEQSQKELDENRAALETQEAALKESEQQLEALKGQIAQLAAAGQAEQAAVLQAQADGAEAQLSAGKTQLEQGKAALEAGQAQIDQGWQELETQQSAGEKALRQARRELDEGETELEEAQQKIDDGKKELEEGEAEYNDKKQEAEEKIADANRQLEDAEKELAELEMPEWYVMGREVLPGNADFSDDADRVAAVAKVFPVFFFLVAALVCLTTMTRMVEEQRTEIGTLKALGFSRGRIAVKYLFYAITATVLGSVVGLCVGFQVFPRVIFEAYGLLYAMPDVIAPFRWDTALICALPVLILCGAAAWSACSRELRSVPAQLMRPKAPKAGKRIFLERIPFLWKRMHFTSKVTARNLFRYKKRFLMTVIGIAGCTALMLAGFGLKNSIAGMIPLQFDEIFRYDGIVVLPEDADEQTREDVEAALDQNCVSRFYAGQHTVDASSGKNVMTSVYLVVPESAEKLQQMVTLRERIGGAPLTLTDEGVILTEKLASKLNASMGKNITIDDGDRRVQAKVLGITENYVYHYIYMTPALYESLYGEPVESNYIYADVEDDSEQARTELSSALIAADALAVSFVTGLKENFGDLVKSLDAIVLILIVCASLLAFVVLYNLTNININERLREIATIKVLGFYDGEVSAYVYRENIALTLIGTAVGLAMGVALHQFVVRTAEVSMVMFCRGVNLMSFVLAAALTFLFSMLVNWAVHYRLKRVSMVESMKAVE